MVEQKTKQVMVQVVPVRRGVCELARRLKVSEGHMSLVLSGKRRSRRLAARLRRLGVEVPA